MPPLKLSDTFCNSGWPSMDTENHVILKIKVTLLNFELINNNFIERFQNIRTHRDQL